MLIPFSYSRFKINTVGGSPTASHFFLLRQRKSNQKEGDPAVSPFGFLRSVNKIGRLRNSHDPLRGHVLKQCSPSPQFYRPPSALQKGMNIKRKTLNPITREAGNASLAKKNKHSVRKAHTKPLYRL